MQIAQEMAGVAGSSEALEPVKRPSQSWMLVNWTEVQPKKSLGPGNIFEGFAKRLGVNAKVLRRVELLFTQMEQIVGVGLG